jgi:hypothetical protein
MDGQTRPELLPEVVAAYRRREEVAARFNAAYDRMEGRCEAHETHPAALDFWMANEALAEAVEDLADTLKRTGANFALFFDQDEDGNPLGPPYTD